MSQGLKTHQVDSQQANLSTGSNRAAEHTERASTSPAVLNDREPPTSPT
jgi:hypothetical protein